MVNCEMDVIDRLVNRAESHQEWSPHWKNACHVEIVKLCPQWQIGG